MQRLLERSAATPAFKAAVLAYTAGEAAPLVGVLGFAPRVKIVRVLSQLLNAEPDLAIESLRIEGVSGCSDFSGVAEVEAEGLTHRIAFNWCCRWRAEQEGWVDYFGFPDQIRAAREFGWDCFERWETLEVDEFAVEAQLS